MSEEVNPPRKYDSRRRREQAARTRRDIVSAALELFLERGYVGTTMSGIAEAAGVAVETVYRAFSSKAAVFKAAVEAAVAGGADRAAVTAEQRPAIQAIIGETDPRRQLEMYAATQPSIHARMGPLLRVLHTAASLDHTLTEIWNELEEQRRAGMGRFAQLLADRGALRTGMSVEEAADLLWGLNSHELYEKLVVQRSWPVQRYQEWLATALVAALLESP